MREKQSEMLAVLVEYLQAHDEGAMNWMNEEKRVALFVAGLTETTTALRNFLVHGAVINQTRVSGGLSLIYVASWQGHNAVVYRLILSGADVN